MVLRLEEELAVFVAAPRQSMLNFPPLSPYQRLALQRLGDRFALAHEQVA